MIIDIDAHFNVASDGTSFTLQYLPPKAEGSDKEPNARAIGHYGDLKGALTGYLKNKLRSSNKKMVVEDVIKYIKKIEKHIAEVLDDK